MNFYQVHAFAAADEKKAEQVAGDEPGDQRADARQQQPAGRHRSRGRALPGALRERAARTGNSSSSAVRSRKTISSSSPAWSGSHVASRSSTSAAQRTQSTSPLFDGFDHPDAETAERSDQPVLIRLGKKLDGVELRDGFPKTADELYRYHAIMLDDLEAGFFTPDQLALLRNFVSQRGGGLLMLGGPDSFASGKYDRTPVGELLPVYLNRSEPAQ